MNLNKLIVPSIAVSSLVLLCCALTLQAEPQDNSASKPKDARSKIDEFRVSEVIARDRAKQMHDIYSATLDVIHHRYFHRETASIPARAMEDVFSEIKQKSKVEARWISVNTKPMSIDHEPNTEFEKRAAKELADGKSDIDTIEDGYYRRAGSISLSSGCLRCHEGLFQAATQKPRYAALVISIPLKAD